MLINLSALIDKSTTTIATNTQQTNLCAINTNKSRLQNCFSRPCTLKLYKLSDKMKNLFKSIFKSSSELRPNIQLPPTAPSSGGRRKRKRDTLKEELHLDDNYDRRRFEICGLFELEIKDFLIEGFFFFGLLRWTKAQRKKWFFYMVS